MLARGRVHRGGRGGGVHNFHKLTRTVNTQDHRLETIKSTMVINVSLNKFNILYEYCNKIISNMSGHKTLLIVPSYVDIFLVHHIVKNSI